MNGRFDVGRLETKIRMRSVTQVKGQSANVGVMQRRHLFERKSCNRPQKMVYLRGRWADRQVTNVKGRLKEKERRRIKECLVNTVKKTGYIRTKIRRRWG